jgi:dienelactone hydrolase
MAILSVVGLVVLVASVASTAAVAENAPLFRFAEKSGDYGVGLHVVEQYDYSRMYRHLTDDLGKPYQGERARPLQTLVWYPAEHSQAKRMTVGDYGNLWATETSFGAPRLSTRAKEWVSAMAPTLNSVLWAVRDAPQTPGRFPVVIYAPSFSMVSWENADLCEYLASHGYVVIASPDMGTTTRSMTEDVPGINAQARDISFLISYAQALPDADPTRIAVAGFSWGGIANLFAAARDNRINALVALDGSLRYYPGLVQQAGDVHPQEMTIPLLYFEQGDMSLEDADQLISQPMRRGASVLNTWTHGDLVTVRMLGMTHQEFSSMYQRSEKTWKRFYDPQSPLRQKADYERKDGITGYAWVARYTLNFLDAYFKHDATAMSFLRNRPAENDAPKHFISVNFRTGRGIPPSFEGFRAEVGRLGFAQAANIYATIRKSSADFALNEEALTDWASELVVGDHVAQAVELLRLNVQIHPDSGDAFESLGDAYRKSGQTTAAIDCYKTSLEKNSFSDIVRRKLEELEGATSALQVALTSR